MSQRQSCLLLAALLALTGCRLQPPAVPKRINSYLAGRADLANVRRIMVLPFHAEDNVNVDCQAVRDAFVAELQKLRRFEVIPLPATAQENELLQKSIHRGRLSTEAVVSLCKRYSLDGILIGTVTRWRAYQPPHLGLRTQLLSVHSGATVWAVDAMYDASDRTTMSDLRHYVATVQQDDGSLHGWEMNLLAPNRFINYVTYRFVSTWTES